jgi:hypothetical protein
MEHILILTVHGPVVGPIKAHIRAATANGTAEENIPKHTAT